MKLYLGFITTMTICCQMAMAGRFNITCYYDTASIKRGGFANYTETDLKSSFEYCTHVVYGYVGLKPDSFAIETLLPEQNLIFSQVKKLKQKNRNITFLVSLGGGKDLSNREKYMKLLEASLQKQSKFIESVKSFVRQYNFDGLDLAYQFPNHKKHKSTVNKMFDQAKKVLSKHKMAKPLKKHIVNVNVHKKRFTELANKLKNTLKRDNLMLTLTVLPHVNASKYLNIRSVMEDFDMVNLGTFDYSTPEYTPNDADYLAPLNSLYNKQISRHRNSNVEQDVRLWLSQHIQSRKLNIGIATYGRAWKLPKPLKSNVMPIKSALDGPASGGELTRTPGLLSWPEICLKVPKMSKTMNKNYGNFAFRTPNVKGQEGFLITYEDRDSLGAKAEFVKRNSLGGIAVFDLSLDDFRGKCKEGQYPALKAIKYKLI
ncbi:chitinase-like protein Idgf3 [Lucilia sericata]|uniref:chitinase-like protein Idgf3 n=1 Tax=Lucilia sericata TaxID=13632 RepID=UPI0018A82B2B|nr:chitinase-like protein Idgf3 [Lucilia sericata]